MKALVRDDGYCIRDDVIVSARAQDGRYIQIREYGYLAVNGNCEISFPVTIYDSNLYAVWVSGKNIAFARRDDNFRDRTYSFSVWIDSGQIRETGNCFGLLSVERGILILEKIKTRLYEEFLELRIDRWRGVNGWRMSKEVHAAIRIAA